VAHWSLSFNRLEKHPTKFQPGGTGILITNRLAHHALWPGNDPMGLGQWCWAQVQGQANQRTWIISMYQPCKSNGPTTLYQQQIIGLAKLNRDVCPKNTILDDLCLSIKQWHEEGDNIIMFMDMNDNIWTPWLCAMIAEVGLVEIITHLHGSAAAPATHQ